ncbi:MAG: serine hydrolase [Gammaproteobacteria bacterium]|nr:serine hydrolase [Gammaproteobacteria bacterium]
MTIASMRLRQVHVAIWTICLAALAPLLYAVPASMGDPLEARLRSMTRGFLGTVTLHARNLDSGREASIDADRPVRTASTIKLPIACALAAEVAAGRARWDEPLVVDNAAKVSGSGVLSEYADGEAVSLRTARNLMIVVSDNTATNLIIDRIRADTVNEFMAQLGFSATRSMRKIRGDGARLKPAEGWSREGEKEENKRFGIGRSTPREMVWLLELLEQGKMVDAASSKELLEVLERQQYKDGIGRKTGDLRVASKSGSLDALRSDVGVVHTKHGRIAIAITVDDMPQIDYSPDNVGNKLIADLSAVLIEELK